MNALADIAAQRYFHTCTVSRSVEIKDGPFTRYELQEVYTDIPCAVSTGGGSNLDRTDEYQPVEYTDTLYTRPEIDIKPGDEITADIYGEIELFTAGAGRKYPSHRQTPVMRKERA